MKVATPLVRGGDDWFWYPEFSTYREQHTVLPVYTEMMLQITSDYSGLPDVLTLTMSRIRWFYNGIRAALKKATAPPKK